MADIWVKNLAGEKALIAETDRDAWRMHGWTEADEPTDRESVWWHKDDVDQPGLIAWGARDYWQGIGWTPSAPPAPVNPTKDPVLTDAAADPAPRPKGDRPTKTTAAPAAPSKEA